MLYIYIYHYIFTAWQLHLFSQYSCEVTGETSQWWFPLAFFPKEKNSYSKKKVWSLAENKLEICDAYHISLQQWDWEIISTLMFYYKYLLCFRCFCLKRWYNCNFCTQRSSISNSMWHFLLQLQLCIRLKNFVMQYSCIFGMINLNWSN